MKNLFVIGVLGIVVIAVASLLWPKIKNCCAKESQQTSKQPVQNLSAEAFKDLLDNQRSELFLLDVRTPAEFADGHIDQPDALIDYRELETGQEQLPTDKNRPILVYCRSGNRSAQAAQKLTEMGYAKIYNLDKGIIDWQTQGNTIEKGGLK